MSTKIFKTWLLFYQIPSDSLHAENWRACLRCKSCLLSLMCHPLNRPLQIYIFVDHSSDSSNDCDLPMSIQVLELNTLLLLLHSNLGFLLALKDAIYNYILTCLVSRSLFFHWKQHLSWHLKWKLKWFLDASPWIKICRNPLSSWVNHHKVIVKSILDV